MSSRAVVSPVVPSFFSGSRSFFLHIIPWFVWTLFVPLFISSASSARFFLSSGIIYFIYSIRALLIGLLFSPPLDPSISPLVASDVSPPSLPAIRRVLIVLNPFGGRGVAAQVLRDHVLPALARCGVHYVIEETEYAGHAREIGEKAKLDQIDAILILGGDGSIHELANGMMRRGYQTAMPPLLIVPTGTGNNIARDLGLFTPADSIARLLTGVPVSIDVNELSDSAGFLCYSFNTVCFGLIAETAHLAQNFRFLGRLRYDLCGLWLLLKGRKQKCNIELKGIRQSWNCQSEQRTGQWNGEAKLTGEFVTSFLNSTQCFGRGQRAAPLARLNDGLFDFTFVRPASRGQFLNLFQLLNRGRIMQHKAAKSVQANQLKIDMHEQQGAIGVDGETIQYQQYVTIRCIPNVLKVLGPPAIA